MRIGLTGDTSPMPTEEELAIGDQTVVLSLTEARELLTEAEDRARRQAGTVELSQTYERELTEAEDRMLRAATEPNAPPPEAELFEVVRAFACGYAKEGDVKAAALRYAAEILAAIPADQVTTYGLVRSFLTVVAMDAEAHRETWDEYK